MKINKDYIFEFASQEYKFDFNHNFKSLKKDIYQFFVVRKMIKRFITKGEINEKLILNNIIICLNIFGIKKTNIIFRIICDDNEFGAIKPCLIFLNSYNLEDTTEQNYIMKNILSDIKHRYNLQSPI